MFIFNIRLKQCLQINHSKQFNEIIWIRSLNPKQHNYTYVSFRILSETPLLCSPLSVVRATSFLSSSFYESSWINAVDGVTRQHLINTNKWANAIVGFLWQRVSSRLSCAAMCKWYQSKKPKNNSSISAKSYTKTGDIRERFVELSLQCGDLAEEKVNYNKFCCYHGDGNDFENEKRTQR